MLQKINWTNLFFLFILIGSFVIPFSPFNPDQESFLDFNTTYNSNNNSQEEFSLDFDLLIMFHSKIPHLGSFDPYVIKKYSNFPVVRIKFNESTSKFRFFKNYQDQIYRFEPNRPLKGSINIIPKSSSIESISDVKIHDSTGANYLHSLGITGSLTKIGIIDTGVYNHTTEFGMRIKGRDVFVTQEYGYSADITDPDDAHGHGTRVAGIAAGTTTGIAPEAEIYSAKVIHDTIITGAGEGRGEETTAGLLEAIDYLVNNSVDVINISLGQYHNLPSGLRDEVIDFVSIMNNTVFTVSAGNSGTSYGDRGTLNNPSTALQCIAVTMTDIGETSISPVASKGPKVDYSLKPDIAAPGINIKGPDNKEGKYITQGSGTSFAAPIVGGAAALLIDYLKRENRFYSAATIKAALLAGARTLNQNIWEEGAGFINITRSWEILNSIEYINNTPDLVYLHPEKLPFDPYKVLFSGSSILFNLTIISSNQMESKIEVSDSLSDFISIPISEYYIDDISTLIPIKFSIPSTTPPQFASGSIKICNKTLDVEFEIRKPNVRVLFDESLNRITFHGYQSNANDIQGDTSNTICMYSALTKYLAYENNYSITPHISGDITLKQLKNYDVLVLANPFSLASDKYMDWIENPGRNYISPSKETFEAIHQFVTQGGGLLILSTDSSNYNITAFNEFILSFGIQIQIQSSGEIRKSYFTNHTLNFTNTIDHFPFYGNFLQITGNYTQVIAEVDNNPTLASYEGPTGGRVLLFGSDLVFDNIGFSSNAGYSGIPEHNRVLAFNSIAWLAEGEYQETTDDPEIPFPLLFLVLIPSLIIIYIFFISKSKK
ncbi:MAG: S8 family serine peptidase [Candidatus Hodarchaeota archaeon]